MMINIGLFGRYYNICIGHVTPWFEQIYFFSITEEYFSSVGLNRNGPDYARMIFGF